MSPKEGNAIERTQTDLIDHIMASMRLDKANMSGMLAKYSCLGKSWMGCGAKKNGVITAC
jgi:hypothetical protein